MTTQTATQLRTVDLADEVRRYLSVVEAFRAAGCEPSWRPESQGGKKG